MADLYVCSVCSWTYPDEDSFVRHVVIWEHQVSEYTVRAPVRANGGFKAVCDCGWKSPTYAVDDHSRDAAYAHCIRTPAHAIVWVDNDKERDAHHN